MDRTPSAVTTATASECTESPDIPTIVALKLDRLPIVRRWSVSEGESVATYDSAGKPILMVVLSGMMHATLSGRDGREYLLGNVRAGGLIGEHAVLGAIEHGHRINCVATTDCEIGELLQDALIEKVRESPELLLDILASIHKKTAGLLKDIELAVFSTSAGQTAALLLKLTDEQGNVEASQAKLARLSGSTRMTIGTQLRRLARRGVITQRRSRIRLVDRAYLENARS